jgi:hypothetical protein
MTTIVARCIKVASGNTQLELQLLVKYCHNMEALRDVSDLAQDAVNQLQSEDLSKREIKLFARKHISLPNAVKPQHQSGGD